MRVVRRPAVGTAAAALVARLSLRSVARAVGLLMAAGAVLGGLAQTTIATGVHSFLPTEDESVTNLNDLAESFGGDPVVVLLEGKHARQLLNKDNVEQVLRLEGRLSTLPNVASVYGPATILNQIAGQTQNLLAELSGRRDAARARAEATAKRNGASPSEAKAAGETAVRDFDRRYGPLLVQGMPSGLPTLRNPGFVGNAIYNQDGQPRPQWHFVVPSVNSIAILVRPREGMEADATEKLVNAVQQLANESDIRTEKTTVSGLPAVASGLGEQVAREIPLLGGIALIAVSACFLIAPWTRRARRLVPVLTTLIAIAFTLSVFGWMNWPISLGVLAFLPVLLGIGAYYPTYFAQRARTRTVLAVAAGTSASFATLMLSPLPFVRDLGIALAIGVLASALVGMLMARQLMAQPPARDQKPGGRFGWPVASRRPLTVLGAIAAIAAVAGWALLPNLPLQSNFQSFAAGLPALSNAKYVEDEIGSSAELDIVVRGENVRSGEVFEWMRQAEMSVLAAHGDELRPVVSPPSMLQFLGPSPTGNQVSSALRLLPPYLVESVIRSDGEMALLSFGVKLDDLGALRALRDEINATLPPPPEGYRVELAGLPIVAVRGHELVSADRFWANTAGIAAAGIALAIGLRRRSDALRAVIAGAIATGMGFCVLWLADIPLSPLTVALGSLTTAIGCEFTVVLAEAVRQGSRRLLRTVLLATATSAIGYAVLAASQLAVIREFGILLAGSVILAVLSASCVVATSVRPGQRRPDATDRATPVRKPTVGAAG